MTAGESVPIPPALVADGLPPVSRQLATEVARYTEFRSARFVVWHPVETEHDSLLGFAATLQNGADFWRLGYDRKNVHQGGDPTDACVPAADGSSVQRCTSVVLGKPKGADESVATIEWRRLVTSRLGLSVKGLFLEEAMRMNKSVFNEWEGHLVLYFLTHTTKGLNGGIDVAYDSLTKEPRARLFIGQSFSLFE